MQNDTLWQKLKYKLPVSYEDIEQYVYTKESIDAFQNFNFDFDGGEYNPCLDKYLYEVEEYESEDDYEEIFFQGYIDGAISKHTYLKHEKLFLQFMEFLYDSSHAYVYYLLDIPLKNNSPFNKCKDLTFDIEKISSNQDKTIPVNDKDFFIQLCYLAAREIESVIFIFPDINAVLLSSGLHGIILFEKTIDLKFIDKLYNILNLTKM